MDYNSGEMIALLQVLMRKDIPDLVLQQEKWDSLLINRRKPHTYRVFTEVEGLRICLHKFDECSNHEAFVHPHPWPGAFIIMSGGYRMNIGYSKDRFSEPTDVATFELHQGSSYEIINPLTWHSVVPLGTTYTIMINDTPWDKDVAHTQVRTTKGKDLEKMPEKDLTEHLNSFRIMLSDWNS